MDAAACRAISDSIKALCGDAKKSAVYWGKVVSSVSGGSITVNVGGTNISVAKCCNCQYGDIVAVEDICGELAATAVKGGGVSGKWATAYGSDPITMSQDSTATSGCLSFKNITGSSGHGFTLSKDGGLVFPYNGNVDVSSYVQIATGFTANDLVHIRITKNGSHILQDVVQRKVSSSYGTLEVKGYTSVSAGDILRVRVYNQTGARGTTSSATSATRLSAAYF